MPSLFSWFKKKEEVDYEKILADIEEKVRIAELELSEVAINERRRMFSLLLYSISSYMVVIAIYMLYPAHDTLESIIYRTGPVVVGPFLILLLRSILKKWHARVRNNLLSELDALKKQQDHKIEELKKKTAYYMTKGLIERYSPAPAKNTPSQPAVRNQHGNNVQRTGIAQPQSFTQNTSQLRISNYPNPETPKNQTTHSKNGNQEFTPKSAVKETWFDKVLDAIVGDQDGPQHKYALICEKCFHHNGLVMPHEVNKKFRCRSCDFLNHDKNAVQDLEFNIKSNGLQSAQESPRLSKIELEDENPFVGGGGDARIFDENQVKETLENEENTREDSPSPASNEKAELESTVKKSLETKGKNKANKNKK